MHPRPDFDLVQMNELIERRRYDNFPQHISLKTRPNTLVEIDLGKSRILPTEFYLQTFSRRQNITLAQAVDTLTAVETARFNSFLMQAPGKLFISNRGWDFLPVYSGEQFSGWLLFALVSCTSCQGYTPTALVLPTTVQPISLRRTWANSDLVVMSAQANELGKLIDDRNILPSKDNDIVRRILRQLP